jgi:hypothetical protein
MSLTRDAPWHNGLWPPHERRAREGESFYRRVLDRTLEEVEYGRAVSEMLRSGCT